MKPSQPVTDNEPNLYRLLPSLHELLLTPDFAALLETQSRDSAISAARVVLARLKQEIGTGATPRKAWKASWHSCMLRLQIKWLRVRAIACGG